MTVGSGIALAPNESDPRRLSTVIRALLEGRSNAVGSCTLSANATTTTVSAMNCGPNSAVFLFQTSANAAAVVASTYVSAVNAGSFVVTHPNNANTDKTFFYVCLG